MTIRQFKIVAASLLFAGVAGAQSPGSALTRALAVLNKADIDGDGRIAAVEGRAAKIPTRDFEKYDFDRDGSLARDEFLLYYRGLLRKAGQAVSRDLEVESARILAKRKARKAEKARREAAKKAPAVPLGKGDPKGKGPAAGRSATQKKLDAEREALRRAKAKEAPKPGVRVANDDTAGRKEP